MAYTTIVAGTTITSAWANANVRDQTIAPFATTGARDAATTSPVVGMVSYISSNDANEGIVTRNSGGQWRLPWNLPWGYVASATTAIDQTGISAATDLTGLAATWTAFRSV